MENTFIGKRVLLAFPDEKGLLLSSKLADEMALVCAGKTKSFEEAAAFLTQDECDFVFMSVVLPLLPVKSEDKDIFDLPLYKRPAVLFFAPENAGDVMLSAYVPTVKLSCRIEDAIKAMDEIYPVRVKDKDVQKAREILKRMGFPEHPAREYIAYACALSFNDRSVVRNLKRSVYPALARAFSKKETAFQDPMRRLIDKTFLSGDIENQYRLFGNSIDETRGKPTVSQLIALVSEMLRMGKA